MQGPFHLHLLPSPKTYKVPVASVPITPRSPLQLSLLEALSLSSATHSLRLWIWILNSTCLFNFHAASLHLLLRFKDKEMLGFGFGLCQWTMWAARVFHPRWAILCNWSFTLLDWNFGTIQGGPLLCNCHSKVLYNLNTWFVYLDLFCISSVWCWVHWFSLRYLQLRQTKKHGFMDEFFSHQT